MLSFCMAGIEKLEEKNHLVPRRCLVFIREMNNSLMKTYKNRINGTKTQRSFSKKPKMHLRKEIKIIKWMIRSEGKIMMCVEVQLV